jgi:toxin-antitoxin system PIN domain toxin
VIAVDTNVLVHAHRRDSPLHRPATAAVRRLAEGRDAWAIPWPCIHEFLAIVTHARVFSVPTPMDRATRQVEAWREAPTLHVLGETSHHWQVLRGLLGAGAVLGPRVHDARVAAICLAHGVVELWTADRDFGRFPSLRTRNPLVGG